MNAPSRIDRARGETAGEGNVDYRTNARMETSDEDLLAEARIEATRTRRRRRLWLFERTLRFGPGQEARAVALALVPLGVVFLCLFPTIRASWDSDIDDPTLPLFWMLVPSLAQPFLAIGRWLSERDLPEAPRRRIGLSVVAAGLALPLLGAVALFAAGVIPRSAVVLAVATWVTFAVFAAQRGEWLRTVTPPF
jgi:hypothetical protein